MEHPALEAMRGKFPVVLCYVATRNGFLCEGGKHNVDIRVAKPFASFAAADEEAKTLIRNNYRVVYSTPGTHTVGRFYVATKYGILEHALSGHAVKCIDQAMMFPDWETARKVGASAAARLMTKNGGILHWAIISL